jgi:cytochrome c peroxidase
MSTKWKIPSVESGHKAFYNPRGSGPSRSLACATAHLVSRTSSRS